MGNAIIKKRTGKDWSINHWNRTDYRVEYFRMYMNDFST